MRRPRDLRGWAALASCLVAVTGLSIVGGRVAEATAGREVSVVVGETARLREYAVRLDRVERAAAVVVDPGPGAARTLSPGGVFVVATWTASGASDPVTPVEPRLVTRDGRSYAPRVGTGGASARLVQPGFDLHWATVFDVPDSALDGAELVVRPVPWRTPLYDTTLHVTIGSVPASSRGALTVSPDRSTLAASASASASATGAAVTGAGVTGAGVTGAVVVGTTAADGQIVALLRADAGRSPSDPRATS